MCGIDEAGRGPLAGPLSIALVYFSKPILEKILKGEILKGLNDSKKIPERKREDLYSEIYTLAYKVVHQFISNKFIDKYGMSYSIFHAIRKLAIKSNLSNLYLLVDGNYNFKAHQANSRFFFNYRSIIKGDSKVASIAAASIVAKVKRDRFMNSIATRYPEYEFEKHKGYGTLLHVSKIKQLGHCPIHRKSFQLKEGAHGT